MITGWVHIAASCLADQKVKKWSPGKHTENNVHTFSKA
jgi:hypothetical protein